MTQVPLKTLRESRGLTQEKLAQLSGVTMGTIRNLESGDSVPRLDTARRVADALGVTLEDAFPSVAA